MSSDDVNKELQKAVNKLRSEYKSVSNVSFIKSGSVVFDALLGGGIPKGVMILWSSESGCGKSTGALHTSKVYCMQGKRVAYLDYEGGVNEPLLKSMGLWEYLNSEDNPDGTFYLFQVQTYKDGEKILDDLMKFMDLVIIDSATSMLTEKVKGASAEDALPGVDSRVMSTFLKRYKADVTRLGVSWIIINQMRTKISFTAGGGDVEAGGNALKFYPDIRIIMKKAFKGTLEKEEETASGLKKVPFGQICEIWAEKNRYERPFIKLNIAILFGKGIVNEFAYYDFLSNLGAVKKSGAWYTIGIGDENCKVQGLLSVINWISNHKDLTKSYINDNGGYRLLMNGDSIDLGPGYDNDSADSIDAVEIDTVDEGEVVEQFEESQEESDE